MTIIFLFENGPDFSFCVIRTENIEPRLGVTSVSENVEMSSSCLMNGEYQHHNRVVCCWCTGYISHGSDGLTINLNSSSLAVLVRVCSVSNLIHFEYKFEISKSMCILVNNILKSIYTNLKSV